MIAMPAPHTHGARHQRERRVYPVSWATSECMFGLEDFRATFADDDAGGHGVSGGHAGHDRPVGNAKVFYSINFQRAINHRHGVLAHLGGAALVPVAHGSIADEALQLGTL